VNPAQVVSVGSGRDITPTEAHLEATASVSTISLSASFPLFVTRILNTAFEAFATN
jgi:hypothetical protein